MAGQRRFVLFLLLHQAHPGLEARRPEERQLRIAAMTSAPVPEPRPVDEPTEPRLRFNEIDDLLAIVAPPRSVRIIFPADQTVGRARGVLLGGGEAHEGVLEVLNRSL